MNHSTSYDLDRALVHEHQLALIRSARADIGPIRRTSGIVLIRIGEWMRGKAEAATEMRPEAAPASLKSA